MFLFLLWPESLCPSKVLKSLVLGDGALGGQLDHQGEAPVNEISALIRETPQNSLAPSAVGGSSEKSAT